MRASCMELRQPRFCKRTARPCHLLQPVDCFPVPVRRPLIAWDFVQSLRSARYCAGPVDIEPRGQVVHPRVVDCGEFHVTTGSLSALSNLVG